jgi:CheY-like chemotaxis protein
MLKPEPVDPTAQLAAAADLIAGALGGTVRIERDIPDDLWPIEIDATEFDLALVNLGLNARDAMGGQGVLTLRASNRSVQDPALGLDGDYLVIEVTDDGAGIDPQDIPKVFDPFFTTKGGAGTGLGLSQVHGFAHQSGGAVAIASEPGHGATVTLYLPATPRPAVSAASQDGEAAPPTEPDVTGTVLVVDDDEGVAGVAASLLEDCGFEVRLAYRARAALDLLRSDGPVDLLFSDIVMPDGMDGIALAQEVRRLQPSLPILLTTGYSDVLADGRAELQGFPVLAKPYKAAELRQGVIDLLRRAA